MGCEVINGFMHYKDLRPSGYQPGYKDYMQGIIGNGCAVDMEMATKNHLTLNFYKQCSKYIQKLYPKLSKGEVYDAMKGIYVEKYSGINQIVLDFRKLLGDQAPTDRVIEKNPTNVLKVYKDILRYYKEFKEKKHQDSTGQEMMMFPQRVQGKKTKMRPQKRGMQQYKKCLKYIETQHPNMSRDGLCDLLSSIYEEKYSGSNKIVLHYPTLIRSPDSSQAKVLKVYYKLLQFWKVSDQGRTPRLVPEQHEESNAKKNDREGTPPENKGMRLFTLVPVKSSFTMSNILIDRKAIMDLILGDKGRNIGKAHTGF